MTNPPPMSSMAEQAARALRAGDAHTAAGLYRTLAEQEPETAAHWANLAIALGRTGDRDGELSALEQALVIEPRLLVALLLKAANLEDRGDLHGANDMFQAALAVAPPFDRAPPELRPMIRRAQALIARQRAAREVFFRDHLSDAYRDGAGTGSKRFTQSVDVLLGKKAIYRQQPHNFYFPGLPETQFYERERFPWLEDIEAATDAIQEEFETVWRGDHGFAPYIAYPPGVPIDQWAELNHSPRWSAFHLIRNGGEIAENAQRCPRTLAAVRTAPAPTLIHRSPNAMFSLLTPRTRIPPHTGETNVRLVVHIPLIIPEQTGFRVGNDTRAWKPGEALIFNDTIEHEAWNGSDQLRTVLIFDIWHPDLTEEEQILIGRLMGLMDEFRGVAPTGGL